MFKVFSYASTLTDHTKYVYFYSKYLERAAMRLTGEMQDPMRGPVLFSLSKV